MLACGGLATRCAAPVGAAMDEPADAWPFAWQAAARRELEELGRRGVFLQAIPSTGDSIRAASYEPVPGSEGERAAIVRDWEACAHTLLGMAELTRPVAIPDEVQGDYALSLLENLVRDPSIQVVPLSPERAQDFVQYRSDLQRRIRLADEALGYEPSSDDEERAHRRQCVERAIRRRAEHQVMVTTGRRRVDDRDSRRGGEWPAP